MRLLGGELKDVTDAVVAFASGATDTQLTLDYQRPGFEGVGMGFQPAQGIALDQYRWLETLAGKLLDEGGLVHGCS
jgi:hypothetical protein